VWIVTRLSLSPNRAARRDDVLVEEDKDKTERGERGRCTMADRDGDAEANEGEKGQRAREREEKKGSGPLTITDWERRTGPFSSSALG